MDTIAAQFLVGSQSCFPLSQENSSNKAILPIDGLSKKRVLFVPASIRSHIIPTLYIADLIAKEYDVFYAVTSPALAQIVSENGFTPVTASTTKVAIGMEPFYLAAQQRPAGFWHVLRSVCTNELYQQRKQELDELLIQIKPDVVIMDIFSSTDFLVLYHQRATVQLLFFNPMPSTYRVGNLPIVSEANWPTEISPTPPAKIHLANVLRSLRTKLYQGALRYQLRTLKKIIRLSTDHELIDTPFSRLFTNVPELILAPEEFELSPKVRQLQQYYLGLNIRQTRTDTELDEEFTRQWPELLVKQIAGQRLIYCSFGTFYTGSNKALLDFITNLLAAINSVPNVQLVCSANNLVIETLRARCAALPNVHFFRRVPQLLVLEHASVHITHGGLGSVKESIYFGVPMLVYPLDAHYDQPGNGLKVEHHGLGLRGDFRWDRAAVLQAKLLRLLNDPAFRINVALFRNVCTERYTDDGVRTILRKLLTAAPL